MLFSNHVRTNVCLRTRVFLWDKFLGLKLSVHTLSFDTVKLPSRED